MFPPYLVDPFVFAALDDIDMPKKPSTVNVGVVVVTLTYKGKRYKREFDGRTGERYGTVSVAKQRAHDFVHDNSPFIELADGHFVPRASVSAVRVETRDHWVSSPGGSEKETK